MVKFVDLWLKRFIGLSILSCLIACTPSGPVIPQYTGTGSITLVSPEDPNVATSFGSSFKFYRTPTTAVPSNLCQNGQLGARAYFLVMETGQGSNLQSALAGGSIVHSEPIELPDDCIFDLDSSFSPKLFQPYLWTVVSDVTIPRESMNWRRLLYSNVPIDLANLPQTPNYDECLKAGFIDDPYFTAINSTWQTSTTNLQSKTDRVADVNMGHNDSGALSINSSQNVLSTQLTQNLQYGVQYQLSFSLRAVNLTGSFKIRAYGMSNGNATTLAPGSGVFLFYESGDIVPGTNDWVRYALTPWKPTDDISHIAIEIVPSNGGSFLMHIDKIGICENFDDPCAGGNTTLVSLPNGQTIPQNQMVASGAVTTETTTDYGPVNDLYPNLDTSTTKWLSELSANPQSATGPMQCNAIGGTDFETVAPPKGFDPESEREMRTFFDAASEWTQSKFGITPILDEIAEGTTIPAAPELDDRCVFVPDPNRPFEGRSIVYVNGLMLPHLGDNYTDNLPKYQHKWATDPEAFYRGGADNAYYKLAELYWDAHIERELGSFTEPSNTYLIANYSTNERLEWGIEAVLTQISDAAHDDIPGLVLGKAAVDRKKIDEDAPTCFGAGGIVIVSHSTGGLLTSAMLGLAELSKANHSTGQPYGDISWLSDFTKLHVSFGGAQVGSPLATAGLAIMQPTWPLNISLSPSKKFLLKKTFKRTDNLNVNQQSHTPGKQTVLVDLDPGYARTNWLPIFKYAKVPTVMAVGNIPGRTDETHYTAGQFLTQGFTDGVAPAISQLVLDKPQYYLNPTYDVHNKLLLWDETQLIQKAWYMMYQGRQVPVPLLPFRRRYFATPYLSPSGMIQTMSVGYFDYGVKRNPDNHHQLLQSTAAHYDVATRMEEVASRPFVGYEPTEQGFSPNYEETAILRDDLKALNIISPKLMDSNRQTGSRLVIGFNYPCGVTYEPYWFLKIELCYWYNVIWQRGHIKLKDGDSQTDVDYVYRYVLRD